MYRLRAKVEIAGGSNAFCGRDALAEGSETKREAPANIRSDGVSYIDPRHASRERTIRLIEYEDTFPVDEAVLAKNRATYEAKRISLGIPKSGTDLIPEKHSPWKQGSTS